MIDLDLLKPWLHKKELQRFEKIFLVIASQGYKSKSIKDIRARATEIGFKIPTNWNIADILGKKAGLVIKLPDGWELTNNGKTHLAELGIPINSPNKVKIANDLRQHLKKLKNEDTRHFVEEAIKCHEHDLWRSAIVMSWVGALHLLYDYVVKNKLNEFNTEARRVDQKWKVAKNIDGLAKMKEADFLDHIERISIIGKSTKDALSECLKRRNGCGHPNSVKYGSNTVNHHIEVLLLNVYEKFS